MSNVLLLQNGKRALVFRVLEKYLFGNFHAKQVKVSLPELLFLSLGSVAGPNTCQ